MVLSAINERAMIEDQEITLFPEKVALSPPKFAIFKRNEWMIQHSDLIISYVKYSSSNAYKWMKKAEKRGLEIINLADDFQRN